MLPKSSETATSILQAAYCRLATDGYAHLNMRNVAAEAGVYHVLIHFYFGSKDQPVIAVIDEANRHLLERQTQLYKTQGDFAAKLDRRLLGWHGIRDAARNSRVSGEQSRSPGCTASTVGTF